MKKLISVMVLFVFLTLTTMAMASQVTTLSSWGPYQTGSGGEFAIAPDASLSWILNSYDTETKNQLVSQTQTFQTFCLESLEHIYLNRTYNAVINNRALNGGVGSAGDPISIGTAYLYSEFAKGTLENYAFGGTDDQRKASAALLQQAIWYLEGEAGGAANYYYNLAVTKLGIADPKIDNNGSYNVAVLNLTGLTLIDGTYLRQDVLVATPIPAALWLLGSGLLGLVGLRRRFKA